MLEIVLYFRLHWCEVVADSIRSQRVMFTLAMRQKEPRNTHREFAVLLSKGGLEFTKKFFPLFKKKLVGLWSEAICIGLWKFCYKGHNSVNDSRMTLNFYFTQGLLIRMLYPKHNWNPQIISKKKVNLNVEDCTTGHRQFIHQVFFFKNPARNYNISKVHYKID